MISHIKHFWKTKFTKENMKNIKHFWKNCPLKKFENLLLLINTAAFLAGAFFLYDIDLFLALFTLFILACIYPVFLLKPLLKKKAAKEPEESEEVSAPVHSLSGSPGEEAFLTEMYTLNKEEAADPAPSQDYQILHTKYQQTLLELREAKEQLSRLNHLQESLLPSYPEAEPDSYDLVSFVHKITLQFNPALFKKRILFEILYDDEILLTKVNMECFSLILRNCMDNAIKYLPQEGKLIITISHDGEDALIILKDNGNGLLIQNTDMLFDLNYQGSNHISGTGLGLAQAKAAAKACGGQIWCKTSPGKGFAIYLKLPVCTRFQKHPEHQQ